MLIREEIEGGGEPKPCYDMIKITHKLSNIKYITVLPERKSWNNITTQTTIMHITIINTPNTEEDHLGASAHKQ